MFVEYPKALYRNGTFSYDEPIDTITVTDAESELLAASEGYWAFGTMPEIVPDPVEPEKRKPGRPKKSAE